MSNQFGNEQGVVQSVKALSRALVLISVLNSGSLESHAEGVISENLAAIQLDDRAREILSLSQDKSGVENLLRLKIYYSQEISEAEKKAIHEEIVWGRQMETVGETVRENSKPGLTNIGGKLGEMRRDRNLLEEQLKELESTKG